MLTEAQKKALNYLAQVASDFCNTLPPSVRGPTVSECQRAIQIIESEVQETAEPKANG